MPLSVALALAIVALAADRTICSAESVFGVSAAARRTGAVDSNVVLAFAVTASVATTAAARITDRSRRVVLAHCRRDIRDLILQRGVRQAFGQDQKALRGLEADLERHERRVRRLCKRRRDGQDVAVARRPGGKSPFVELNQARVPLVGGEGFEPPTFSV